MRCLVIAGALVLVAGVVRAACPPDDTAPVYVAKDGMVKFCVAPIAGVTTGTCDLTLSWTGGMESHTGVSVPLGATQSTVFAGAIGKTVAKIDAKCTAGTATQTKSRPATVPITVKPAPTVACVCSGGLKAACQ